MTTPRTMNTVKQAAEKAGERAYARRRRAIEAAAKARAAVATQPDSGDSAVAPEPAAGE